MVIYIVMLIFRTARLHVDFFSSCNVMVKSTPGLPALLQTLVSKMVLLIKFLKSQSQFSYFKVEATMVLY